MRTTPANRCRLVTLFVSVAFLQTTTAAASTYTPELDLTGYLQESVSFRRSDLNDVLFHRQTLNIDAETDLGDSIMVSLEADLWRDNADFLGAPEGEARLREGFARYSLDAADLTVGRWQTAWGESDAVIVSDQITPFDFSNFIVPEFDEIRLGVDGILFDYYLDNGDDVQLIWISRFQPPDLARLDSPWSLLPADLIDTFGVVVEDTIKPGWAVENSEYGIRYSGHPLIAATFVDWSIGYFYSWDDRPALRLTSPGGIITLTPEHERYHLFALNIAAPVRSVLLRIDSAYERGRYLSTFDVNDPFDPAALPTAGDGFVVRQDVWRTLVGIDLKPDFKWWQQADLSLQLVHEQVTHPHAGLAEARETDLIVIIAQAAYLNETVSPWLLAVVNTSGDDYWVQAKIDYEPFDDWRFTIESDVFVGHAFDGSNGGRFGNFDENDMIMLSARYSY